ncbi:hypothetical protein Gogos_000583 [Gossypium gossypioides]|uniref:Uncharacterized protein n=1 Tax=Gossypium gossypioides TaxID=34282 RepID=A0A7J9CTW4_GOSGO|nr:hypothetical protein [Gossypium gossypioides]
MHTLLMIEDMQPSMQNLLRRKVVNPRIWSSLDSNIYEKIRVTN